MKEYFLQCSDALRSKLLVQVTDQQMCNGFPLSLNNMPVVSVIIIIISIFKLA